MRVQETVPQFTFGFSGRFVNEIYRVSTGFFGFFLFLSDLAGIQAAFAQE
jgi:hypothetical protein